MINEIKFLFRFPFFPSLSLSLLIKDPCFYFLFRCKFATSTKETRILRVMIYRIPHCTIDFNARNKGSRIPFRTNFEKYRYNTFYTFEINARDKGVHISFAWSFDKYWYNASPRVLKTEYSVSLNYLTLSSNHFSRSTCTLCTFPLEREQKKKKKKKRKKKRKQKTRTYPPFIRY